METRVAGINENLQNISLQLHKSRFPRKLLSISRQLNIKLSAIAYANNVMIHDKSRKLESRLHPIDYFATRHRGQRKGDIINVLFNAALLYLIGSDILVFILIASIFFSNFFSYRS